MHKLLALVLVVALLANMFAGVELLHSIRYCFRRRVFWRVHPAGLTAAGPSSRPSLGRPSQAGSAVGDGHYAACNRCAGSVFGTIQQVEAFARQHVCADQCDDSITHTVHQPK